MLCLKLLTFLADFSSELILSSKQYSAHFFNAHFEGLSCLEGPSRDFRLFMVLLAHQYFRLVFQQNKLSSSFLLETRCCFEPFLKFACSLRLLVFLNLVSSLSRTLIPSRTSSSIHSWVLFLMRISFN